jgi:hypothetical protein
MKRKNAKTAMAAKDRFNVAGALQDAIHSA